ncbi:hypothetical protein GF407_13435 [candidate division KSB1 bacterium]|nr:hypothetical protein [candidate division KSB1 bacterium]
MVIGKTSGRKAWRVVWPTLLCVVFCTFLSVDCAYHVGIQPKLNDLPRSEPRLDQSVAVVISQALQTRLEQGNLNAGSGSAHAFVFKIGPPLSRALLAGIENRYSDVELLSDFPNKKEYDYIIAFEFNDAKLDLYFQDGFVSTTAKAHYILSIDMSVYKGSSYQILKKEPIQAKAISSNKLGNENTKEVFTRALESAIEQLAYKTGQYFINDKSPAALQPARERSPRVLLDIKKVLKNYLLVYYPQNLALENGKTFSLVRMFHFNGEKGWRPIGFAEVFKTNNGKAAMRATVEQHYAPITIADKIEYHP